MSREDQWETPLHRYISMVKDVQSYLEYTVEMEKLAMQMNACGKQTRAYASLSFQYDTYRVARETYWGKMAETYGVTSLEALARDMRALEPRLSGRLSTVQALGVEPIRPSLLPRTDTDISDQNMKAWLSERIVRLALYRCKLSAIGEQIEALDQHADSLQGKGQPVPEVEQQQRETLEGAYLCKHEEVQQAFEPGCVAKTLGETRWAVKSRLLFSLGGHSKQVGDERHLSPDISFVHPLHLPFPDHIHDLVSLQRVPCRFRREEA